MATKSKDDYLSEWALRGIIITAANTSVYEQHEWYQVRDRGNGGLPWPAVRIEISAVASLPGNASACSPQQICSIVFEHLFGLKVSHYSCCEYCGSDFVAEAVTPGFFDPECLHIKHSDLVSLLSAPTAPAAVHVVHDEIVVALDAKTVNGPGPVTFMDYLGLGMPPHLVKEAFYPTPDIPYYTPLLMYMGSAFKAEIDFKFLPAGFTLKKDAD